MTHRKRPGKVYLIGAGPGDPGLITVKGRLCLQEADVVIYDYLVAKEILEVCGPQTRQIYVGKSGAKHTASQEEINRMLVKEAKAGRIVARLKGGDPFIFGRGGEEALVLAKAGIPYEIVPGVTSAIAVPAYAGIPLTYRGYTSTVAFVTGHEDPAKGESAIDWESLSQMGTIVFLMGISHLAEISRRLTSAGKAGSTPAALIRWGTTAAQKTLVSSLAQIAQEAEAAGFQAPAILVVGSVVSLRTMLNWYERLPLFGQGIVITRPLTQADELRSAVMRLGAHPLLFPTIAICPPKSWCACDHVIAQLGKFHWVIFTSANGVDFFFQRLRAKGGDARALGSAKIAVIGPATAAALTKWGLRADLCPEEFTSEGLATAFRDGDAAGQSVLLLRAEEASELLPQELRKRGAQVKEVTVYRTTLAPQARKEEFLSWIDEDKISCLTFTSPSTFHYFRRIVGETFIPAERIKVAVIGPVTEAAVRQAGWPIHIQAQPHTVAGLISGLVAHFHPQNAAGSKKDVFTVRQ